MLQAISDGLTAFLTLQARVGLAPAYSEYLLYDPVVRVARYRGWGVECEVPMDKAHPGRGDARRIDFRLRRNPKARRSLLLEIKYQPSAGGKVYVAKDVEKLREQLLKGGEGQGSRAFVLVAGRERRTGKVETGGFDTVPSLGTPVYSTTYRAAHTTFGVRVFEVR